MPLKDILTLDIDHPTGIEEKIMPEQLDFIKVNLLLSKATSLIQPKNQLVIANIKNLYTKALLSRCFKMYDGTSITLRKF